MVLDKLCRTPYISYILSAKNVRKIFVCNPSHELPSTWDVFQTSKHETAPIFNFRIVLDTWKSIFEFKKWTFEIKNF